MMNCLPASAEVVSSALGYEVSEEAWRAIAGGDPNIDMIEDVYFGEKLTLPKQDRM